jgi:hypothetical protein
MLGLRSRASSKPVLREQSTDGYLQEIAGDCRDRTGAAAGADGRGPLEGGCGGCQNATVANSTAPTPKYTVDWFQRSPLLVNAEGASALVLTARLRTFGVSEMRFRSRFE